MLDIPLQERLSERFSTVIIDHPDYPLKVLFREGGRIGANALALPAGTIIFTDEMVRLSEDDTELVTVLAHEIGHIFEYEIIFERITGGSTSFSRPPTWVFEGFSELSTMDWPSFSLLTVRDTVLSDRMPTIGKSGRLQGQYTHGRTPYDFGHLIFDFVEEKYGKRGVRNLIKSFKGGSLLRGKRNILSGNL